MYANSEANPNAFNGLDPDQLDTLSANPKPAPDSSAAAASATNHDRSGTQRAHLHAASAALSALRSSANSGTATSGDALSAALELIRLHNAAAGPQQQPSHFEHSSSHPASQPHGQPQSPAPPQPPTLFPGKTAYTSLYMLYNLSAVHSIPMLLSWLTNVQLTTLSNASLAACCSFLPASVANSLPRVLCR